MKNAFKLFWSTTTLIISLILCGVYTFAWFALNPGGTNRFIVQNGDIDLDVAVYYANDSDKDGVFDNYVEGTNYSRTQMMEFYTQCQKAVSTDHDQVAPGSQLNFKISIINDSAENQVASNIEILFAEMQSYFYQFLQEYLNLVTIGAEVSAPTIRNLESEWDSNNEQKLESILGANSARIMFLLSNLQVRVYSGTSGDTRTSGFGTLARSSVQSEVEGDVIAISTLNQQTPTLEGYHLWQFCNGQSIIENIILNPDELMEIDFKLACTQSNILMEYKQYALDNYYSETERLIVEYYQSQNPAVTLTNEQMATICSNYIDLISTKELTYLAEGADVVGGGGISAKLLSFQIKKIFINGYNA